MANRRQFIESALFVFGAAAVHPASKAFAQITEYRKLPQDIKFYDINGQMLFPIYAENGGLSTMQVCYLLRGRTAICIGFRDEEFAGKSDSQIEHEICWKLTKAVNRGNWQHVDWNGGCLPRPEEV